MRQTQISGSPKRRNPIGNRVGHRSGVSDSVQEIASQFFILFFGSWSSRFLCATVSITVSRRSVAISRRSVTVTRRTIATLTTTAASEAFECFLQFIAIQCSVFVRVSSVEHPLHSLGHFVTAEFAVFVFVKAHDSVDHFAGVTELAASAFSATTFSATTFSATTFSATTFSATTFSATTTFAT
ncbi:MAG: hypothetical protein ACI93T_004698, partial [Porticoccaceae bacterium]